MKRIVLSLFAFGLVALGLSGIVPGFPSQFGVRAAEGDGESFTFDVACDCRTGSPAFFGGNRGDAFIVNGKMFPAGTLPFGTATNDPTQPANGIAPIGNWICRGQVAGTLPPPIASAYASTPFAFNTQYYILNDGRALTAEGYDLPGEAPLSVTGGIGSFSGAAGDIQVNILGANGSGCPNFRAKFNFRPGSVR